MLEGVVDRDLGEGLEGPRPERAAGGRQDESPHLGRRAGAESLVERAMLGIDGQDRRAGRSRRGHERLARDDERLLVRERERLADLDGLVSRDEARRAHDPAEDDVCLGDRRDVYEPPLAEADGDPRELAAHEGSVFGRPHGHDLRAVGRDGRKELLEVRARGHRDDLETIREVRDDRERRVADRARRPEERDALSGVRHGRPPGRRVRARSSTGEA